MREPLKDKNSLEHVVSAILLIRTFAVSYESSELLYIVAYNEELDFYESYGFKKADDASPMFITNMWT